jgi:hypothetical protein
MMRFVPLLIGIAAVAASAYDSGRVSGRWHKSDDVSVVARKLQQVPAEIGDWRSEERTIDAHQLEIAGVVGYVSRLYVNRKTGERVQLLLICGRPQPISVHTPDVCYAGAGYAQEKDLQKLSVAGDAFKEGKFVKGPPQPDSLRIAWAWSTDGQWSAPDSPRQTFGRGINALFKLYVLRQLGPTDAASTADPIADFLEVMLPELKRCLAPSV